MLLELEWGLAYGLDETKTRVLVPLRHGDSLSEHGMIDLRCVLVRILLHYGVVGSVGALCGPPSRLGWVHLLPLAF